MTRTYSELERLPTFEERFDYLRLFGYVGRDTFGYDRYLNQAFYRSREWKQVREYVLVRDNGCDLAMPGHDIPDGEVLVHHMNPISVDNIVHGDPSILDPEFLITVTHRTHNAIHYGTDSIAPPVVVERTKGDTIPW